MRGGLSDYHKVLCKVRLVGALIKRREVVTGTERIRSEKLRVHQYVEGYAWCLEKKRLDWDKGSNTEQM